MVEFAANILIKELQYISSKDILEGGIWYQRVPIRLLQQICFHTDTDMDETALLRKLHYLREWVETMLKEKKWKIDALQEQSGSLEGIGIFDLLHCLVSKILISSQGKIVYRYKYLKIWQLLSGKLGANLFTASAYARRDYELFIQRSQFTGIDIISHDNHPLNAVLNQGMSDNHFHLRASVPYFILSWISLMNSVTGNQVSLQLDKMNDQPRDPKVRYRYEYDEDKFSILHLKAAAIRVYLYAFLTRQMLEFGEYKVSIEWLFAHILQQEPVERILCENKAMHIKEFDRQNGDISIQQFLEGKMGSGFGQLRDNCPGFYWLLWECFPFIPLKCLKDIKKILCRENRGLIAAYIKQKYGSLPLSRCAWLFHGKNKETYHREWGRQTKQALQEMLNDVNKLEGMRFHIQHVIDSFHSDSFYAGSLHTEGSHKHATNRQKGKDYTLNYIRYDDSVWEQAVMSGELWLIYEMEKRRYSNFVGRNGQDTWEYQLFFAYLTIKEAFRSELLQNNEKIGFRNFQAYQKRKDWFTTAFSEGELARIAVRWAYQKQNLNSLELRVMPQDTDVKNIQLIQGYDKAIGMCHQQHGDKQGRSYYYVFHFGKREDADGMYGNERLHCRHAAYRDHLRCKVQAIMSMRERNPTVGSRLKGVDACSSEDGCRPEVFAVAFRVLKSHIVYREWDKRQLPQLRVSYHVGEENQDILDGLRAIDEAVYFLQLGSGDRLGHATMLGTEVGEWYERNNYMVSIRQQDYLDNVAWLYHQIIHYHVSNQDNLLEYLEHEFQKYFYRIYEQWMSGAYNELILSKIYKNRKKQPKRTVHMLDYNIHNYYNAWELRGDGPQLYLEGYYKQKMPGSLWDDQQMNHSIEVEKREIDEAVILYHTYHYNKKVQKEGNRSVVVKIPYHMVCGIALIQKELQMEIAKRGIAIETNPTSNLRISGLPGYASHPIVAFYNKGLTLNEEQIRACPQIQVSINTDDPGVFTTSLYNEYTLMAGALEQIKMRDGTSVYKKDMVYDWINNIRKIGNMQPFDRNPGTNGSGEYSEKIGW